MDNSGTGSTVPILQELEVRHVPDAQCHINANMHSQNYCVGSMDGTSSTAAICLGDSGMLCVYVCVIKCNKYKQKTKPKYENFDFSIKGGPLYIFKSNGEVLQAGVTSWVKSYDSSTKKCSGYGVYVEVSEFLGWIG